MNQTTKNVFQLICDSHNMTSAMAQDFAQIVKKANWAGDTRADYAQMSELASKFMKRIYR